MLLARYLLMMSRSSNELTTNPLLLSLSRLYLLWSTTRYAASSYWAAATILSVGFGDVTPPSRDTWAFSCVAIVGGVGFYGLFIASMVSVMSNLDANSIKRSEKMSAITSYMKVRRLPRRLRLRVRRYYKNYFAHKTCLDESEILGSLSTFLRREVTMHLLSDSLYTIPFFQGRDPDVLARVLTLVKPLHAAAGDALSVAGEPGEEMFVVVRGRLAVLDGGGGGGGGGGGAASGGDGSSEERVVYTLTRGQYFGELQLLGVSATRTATLRAETACELQSVGKHDLFEAFAHDPELLADMARIAYGGYDAVHGATDRIPAFLSASEAQRASVMLSPGRKARAVKAEAAAAAAAAEAEEAASSPEQEQEEQEGQEQVREVSELPSWIEGMVADAVGGLKGELLAMVSGGGDDDDGSR